MSVWTGRLDTADGPTALRWHQMVKPLTQGCPPGVALIGFACDEGVRRNGGRVGAKDGPRAIRQALANLAWRQDGPVYDAGDVACAAGDLEAAQDRLAEAVSYLVAAGHRPIVLGGGHETAWGSFQGIVAAKPNRAKVGVINVDAHLDLRADRPPHSGTPFHQIAEWCRAHDRPFHHFNLGYSSQSNTVALTDRADELGVVTLPDIALPPWELETAHGLVAAFVHQCRFVHLSIDLDVLPAAVMPAVSAPAPGGVPLEAVEPLVGRILSLGKTTAVDIVELNPPHDVDGRGARVAARLAWLVARNWV